MTRTNILLGILVAGTLTVVGALVYWNLVFFPPAFTGWGEVTPEGTVAGWAIYRNDPGRRVEVELYIDDQFIAYAIADLPRPDVVQAGWTPDVRCGYNFAIPKLPAGEHIARVYALHRVKDRPYITLQMTGNPIRLYVNQDGHVTAMK